MDYLKELGINVIWLSPVYQSPNDDNARTPMQWNASENAGFSTGTPWIMVNPNYTEINAEAELSDPDSIFRYYQKLIALRKENDIIVYGSYDLLDPENPDLYVYTRTLGNEKLLVVCNYTEEEKACTIPAEFVPAEILINNYPNPVITENMSLRPYEAFVLRIFQA